MWGDIMHIYMIIHICKYIYGDVIYIYIFYLFIHIYLYIYAHIYYVISNSE